MPMTSRSDQLLAASKLTVSFPRPLTSQEGVRSVFGGFLVAQAVSAASTTVPDGFRLYSSQSSFLAPANGDDKVTYRVDRTADGRSYCTRVVRATQGEACVYAAIISFQKNISRPAGNVLRYGTPMPDLEGTGPDDISAVAIQEMQNSTIDRSAPLMQLSAEDRPLDWRPLGMEISDDPSQFWIRGFVRSPPLSTDDPLVHLAAFAYMSDEFSFGPALLANPKAAGKGMRNVAMGASLTHNVSFHDPRARVDEWTVLERKTSWGGESRVHVSQRMWNMKTGKLVMSGTQEALIRLKGHKL